MRQRLRGARVLILLTAAVVLLLGVAVSLTVTTQGRSSGWVNAGMDVVGSPISVDGLVIVLDVTASHQLELVGIDPSGGTVVWKKPFDPSGITPGVAFGPTAVGNIVMDLAPAGVASTPAVKIEGLDATTGRVAWSLAAPVVASDAPVICGGGADFCIPAFTRGTKTSLATIDP
jgi:outer membrane protein assembly factor BamB